MRHENEVQHPFYGFRDHFDAGPERRGDRPVSPSKGPFARPDCPPAAPPYGRRGMMPPPPPPMPPEELTVDGRLLALLRMAGHLAMMRPGLRSGQYRLLSLLSGGEPVSQRQLAAQMRIQPGSLSELLGKLEQAGAVTRERSSEDRRACSVQITATGKERLEKMQESMDIDRSELLCCLTDEEKTTLTALLEKLMEGNTPRRPGHRGGPAQAHDEPESGPIPEEP